MRNDANQFPILLQACEGLQCDIKGFLIQGAKAFGFTHRFFERFFGG